MPLKKLNKEQYDAATAPYGYNLIIASAGTGKTSTIVGRIGNLLSSGVKPSEILLLTFTNKAAAEMVARVASIFGKEVASQIVAGTFHSVSYKWLKLLEKPALLKQPSELKLLFKTVYESFNYSKYSTDKKPLTHQALLEYYWLWQNSTFEEFGDWLVQKNPDHDVFMPMYYDMMEKFDILKKDLGVVGFNDLLSFMADEFRNGVDFGIKEILVDEYQDTNPLQNSLLESMRPNSLFCVGDYDQSIYAFNGAQIEIIATFRQRYENSKVFSLEKNYRSTKPILSLANKVIEFNDRIYPKKLEVVREDVFSNPTLLEYSELYEQYMGIATKIQYSQFKKDDIAVIFRNNSTADGLEVALRELKISCKRKGSGSFFDAREVKVVLDLLTLFVNERDLLSFIHVLEYAPSLGSASSKDIYDALLELGDRSIYKGLYAPKKLDIFQKKPKQYSLFNYEEELPVKDLKRAKISDSFRNNPILKHPKINNQSAEFLYKLKELLSNKKRLKTPYSIIDLILKSELFEYVSNNLSKKRATKNQILDESLQENSKENIISKIKTLMELSKHYKDTERFLNAMVLGQNEMSEGNGVNLLSIHASKGLEYDEVYVVDLMDGRFPNRKLMAKGGSLDEERRLFYVAVTRAKTSLYLSFARYDKYKKIDYQPSQFLYEASLITKTK